MKVVITAIDEELLEFPLIFDNIEDMEDYLKEELRIKKWT